MRLICWYCHKVVSNELPSGTVFRAIAVCPECIEKETESCPDCGEAVTWYHDAEGASRAVCKDKCKGWKVLREIDRSTGYYKEANNGNL